MRQIVQSQKPDMLCVQESKLIGVDRKLCSILWEGDDFEWLSKDAEGRSRGLLIIWRKGSFNIDSTFHRPNYLGVDGFWGSERLKVTIVNVYAPCDLRGTKRLWEEITTLMVDRGEVDGAY